MCNCDGSNVLAITDPGVDRDKHEIGIPIKADEKTYHPKGTQIYYKEVKSRRRGEFKDNFYVELGPKYRKLART
jgi:hypothetical protein